MGKHLFWKGTLSLVLWGQLFSQAVHSSETQVGSLSEGACWYEYKEALRVASFNDKTAYFGNKNQIDSELEALMASALLPLKVQSSELVLHCGGYGASLVAKVATETGSFCLWSKFEKGKLSLRSIGAIGEGPKNPSELCDGHKWGEFIMGVQSNDMLTELQSLRWAGVIKEVRPVADKVLKVVLVKEYEFREQEVIDQLKENFSGKNLIRYIEFNDYRHPIGEFVHLR